GGWGGLLLGGAVLSIACGSESTIGLAANCCGVCFQQAFQVEALQLRRRKALESVAAIASNAPGRRRQPFAAFAAYVPAQLVSGKFGGPEQSRQPGDSLGRWKPIGNKKLWLTGWPPLVALGLALALGRAGAEGARGLILPGHGQRPPIEATVAPAGGGSCSNAPRETSSLCSVIYAE